MNFEHFCFLMDNIIYLLPPSYISQCYHSYTTFYTSYNRSTRPNDHFGAMTVHFSPSNQIIAIISSFHSSLFIFLFSGLFFFIHHLFHSHSFLTYITQQEWIFFNKIFRLLVCLRTKSSVFCLYIPLFPSHSILILLPSPLVIT